MENEGVRIDKWLWSVRLYKTRTLAAEACKAGRVLSSGRRVKPSYSVKLDEIISAETGWITRTVKVLGLLERRVGAPVAKQYAEDLTPASEYQKLKERNKELVMLPPKGFGRPTKKDRRTLDQFFERKD